MARGTFTDRQGARSDDGRWAELVRIATEVFAERGYTQTGLQEIAERFGVLKGSLYHYFRNKDDLLWEIVRSVYMDGVSRMSEVVAGEKDPLTRLRAIVRFHVLYVIENLTAITVFLHDLEHLSPERRRELPVDDYAAITTQAIADAQRSGVIRDDIDPALAALTILGAGNWVYRWYDASGSHSPTEIADQMSATLVDGLLSNGSD